MKQDRLVSEAPRSGMPISMLNAHSVRIKYRVDQRVEAGARLLETVYNPAIFLQMDWAVVSFDPKCPDRTPVHLLPGDDHERKFRELGLNPQNLDQLYILGLGISKKESPEEAALHRQCLREAWLVCGMRRQNELTLE